MRIVGELFKERKNKPLVKPIYLYQIQLDADANTFKRFSSFPGGTVFQGLTWEQFAITHNNISEDGSGQVQKAKLTLLNITREVQAFIDDNDGLRDREVIILQVWEETLADPDAFIADTFFISDTLVTEREAKFSLASKLDVLDLRLPKRIISRTFCRFKFKDTDCGYTGTELTCDKSLQRCRELVNVKRFGGFPATPLQRIFLESQR